MTKDEYIGRLIVSVLSVAPALTARVRLSSDFSGRMTVEFIAALGPHRYTNAVEVEDHDIKHCDKRDADMCAAGVVADLLRLRSADL